MIMELKKNRRLGANKRKMGVSGHDGELVARLKNVLVQSCQSTLPPPFLKDTSTHTHTHALPPPHTHTHTHCCYSLLPSRCTWRNPSNPKKHMIPNLGRKRKNPDVSLPPSPRSLHNRLVGCLRAVDVCALLWLVPDVLHWPKSPMQ